MKEFRGEDLKVLRYIAECSGVDIEERYTSDIVKCPTCKESKARRRFIGHHGKEFTLCNSCRAVPLNCWAHSNITREKGKAHRSDTNAERYIKMLEDNIS